MAESVSAPLGFNIDAGARERLDALLRESYGFTPVLGVFKSKRSHEVAERWKVVIYDQNAIRTADFPTYECSVAGYRFVFVQPEAASDLNGITLVADGHGLRFVAQ